MVKKDIKKKLVVKKTVKISKPVHNKHVVHSEPKSKKIEAVTASQPKRVAANGAYFAVGRRKEAVARIRFYSDGKGEIIINNQTLEKYFSSFEHQFLVQQPLKATGVDKYKITVKVSGGGKNGQAEAVRHGIARALLLMDSGLRTVLKPLGLLTRDARVKERKKPGLKRARRAPQWQKR